MQVDPRQEALKAAVFEAGRFIRKANLAFEALNDPSKTHNCLEYAAAKRSSMDLTNSLPNVRKATK